MIQTNCSLPLDHTTRSPSHQPLQTPNSPLLSLLTPLSSPSVDQSPNETQLLSSAGGMVVQIPPAAPLMNTQPSIGLSQLAEPSVDAFNPVFAHDLNLELPESFPRTTPGNEFRNVKLASRNEQEVFIKGLKRDTKFIEMSVTLPEVQIHE